MYGGRGFYPGSHSGDAYQPDSTFSVHKPLICSLYSRLVQFSLFDGFLTRIPVYVRLAPQCTAHNPGPSNSPALSCLDEASPPEARYRRPVRMHHALRFWLPLCSKRGLGSSWLLNQNWQRAFSSRSRGEDVEKLKVVCGSSGSIDVDLYNPPVLQNPSSPLIIYLPPTGVHLQTSHPPIPSYLIHPSAALATINYRWNIPSPSTSSPPPSSLPPILSSHPSFSNHAFPTPLHDTLHAYTYLLQTLLPSYSPSQPQHSYSPKFPFSPRSQTFYAPQSSQKTVQRPILIYGSYLSASLATSLALTESFASKQCPTRTALLVHDGIYDWTTIATSPPPPSPSPLPIPHEQVSGQGSWDSKTLYALRTRLFSTPSSAFDAFVSPVLFFRTAGVGVPKTWPVPSSPSPPEPSTSSPGSTPPHSSPLISHNEEVFYSIPDLSFVTDPDSDLSNEAGMGRGKDGGSLDLEVTRKSNLKFPPKDSGLKIPRSLFLYSGSNVSPSGSFASKSKSRRSAASKQASKQAKKTGSSLDVLEEAQGETAQGQSEEMVRLMRRSIQLHEFKERMQWDEDFDPEGAAVERVGISGVESKGEEERVAREWIEDVFDA